MRIAYDFQIFSAQQYGGISRYFAELAMHMAYIPVTEVGIITPLYINSYLTSLPKKVKVIGRYVPKLKHLGGLYNGINQILAPILQDNYNPDLLHQTYYSKNIFSSRKKKVVLTVFDMIHERFPEYFLPSDQTSLAKARAIENADHIICISESTRQDLINLLNISSKKISVVHLGVWPVNTKGGILPHSRPYILFVGKRGGYKNFEKLLYAYASNDLLMADYDLIAFGGGRFNGQEQEFIKALGIKPSRVLHASGNDALLASFYRGAAVFVYPSQYEGFGIPPLEAMSVNCPVICSNTSSMPEVVGDAAYFCDPNSIESIERAITNVLNDAVLRASLIAEGGQRVRNFSWQKCAAETFDVYQRLLL